MSTIQENEEYFTKNKKEIIDSADDDSNYVVIWNCQVVGYCKSVYRAIDIWLDKPEAIIKDLYRSRTVKVSSNYLRH